MLFHLSPLLFLLLFIFKFHYVFQEKNLDWFPRMRAMSLTAEEGEGEQNELRNLQQQLESTTSLVQVLSLQLTELKEQVRL